MIAPTTLSVGGGDAASEVAGETTVRRRLGRRCIGMCAQLRVAITQLYKVIADSLDTSQVRI